MRQQEVERPADCLFKGTAFWISDGRPGRRQDRLLSQS
jgi:hypothetical protein